ncbi:MAG: Ni/Fe hydrogenase subunit alpha [Chloroflexaceae bacterium]|nr:Ni/Fe hydrogenase subunit alpha [Chloroflexaceae bacterium]
MKNIIKVDYLARVEGEGGLFIKMKDHAVSDVKLRIFEPPRFFEAFLRNRSFREVPDITARICGICPVAYQMSSVHAMEDACGVKVEGPLRELRRLLYCGEWIESHVLHFSMLHAPDFLGYPDAIAMAKDHPDVVKKMLQLKKIGNDIVTFVGGREIHPINICVGGFYRVPTRREMTRRLSESLKEARELAIEAAHWTASLPCPDFEQAYEYVSLQHPDEYPYNEGRLVSNQGLDIPISAFYDHITEEHMAHSTSLHSVLKARGSYHVGPLARYNLNFEKLTPLTQEVAHAIGLGATCHNPFKSIVVRSLETLYACDEALRIIDAYEMPERPAVEVQPRAGVGHGCTEAPRGVLYHRYKIDEQGTILDARIAPPTAQNQRTIEKDLHDFVTPRMDTPHEKLTWECEQVIRNYDPCISCSTHFLTLHIEHEETGSEV